ncbi:LutB/LldF family L-lactate oxidation iron-sulfur protein [Oscillatoria amoena NRMC-F 0135]|nr:LutB/LldF family L-lactate oxidation iron-sulfur protein [Oscillatoria laete-virens]MDL5049147.1 LutB/LldF family L-lactate oxidation iron-sulfur protein [Oscillatoria amoena NRMC-F 0135]MDL5052187.1 LutB/LldF family L-lactate oxidation iron-sulfur protein [Oscillatoria laete-virens NRMC-F 0139]
MATQKIDSFALKLEEEVRASVRNASALKTKSRVDSLWRDFEEPDKLRETAGQIKQHVVENLDTYLEKAEAALTSRGVKVHWASDADEARRIILDLMRGIGATKMVKSKSMVSEEIELAHYLEEHGMSAVETDLGEFIVQIDHDHPSHIVTPIIHKNRRQVAKSFEREGLGEYNDDPQVITARARKFLRAKYLEADVGLTGANFVSAESGRIVLVTNEGNSRFCMAPTKMHIALVGIEKIIPHDRDLELFLNLLSRSATGQKLTIYTEFINGPKAPEQPDGPEQMHVVFLDNGRSDVLASECREILRCIRCGACLNVCPVYRQASGHAYRSVYPGPVGAVLSPILNGKQFPELADLPKASSLCGACNEVCPVNIPIPDLLLRLRDKAKQEHIHSPNTPPMGGWSILASQPMLWKSILMAGAAMNVVNPDWIPLPPVKRWTSVRKLPRWRGGEFRKWFKNRPQPRTQKS